MIALYNIKIATNRMKRVSKIMKKGSKHNYAMYNIFQIEVNKE